MLSLFVFLASRLLNCDLCFAEGRQKQIKVAESVCHGSFWKVQPLKRFSSSSLWKMVSEEEEYIWLKTQEDRAKIYREDKHIKQVFLGKAVCTIRWIKGGGMRLHSYWLGGRKTPAVYFICAEVMEVSYACSLKLAQEHILEGWGKRQLYSTETFSNPWRRAKNECNKPKLPSKAKGLANYSEFWCYLNYVFTI